MGKKSAAVPTTLREQVVLGLAFAGFVLLPACARNEDAPPNATRPDASEAKAWSDCIAAIASSPKYGALRIVPQEGLVPLGPDPDSSLQEFAQRGSGSIPRRDPRTQRLAYADDAAIVLVLLPGGTFRMGAQKDEPRGSPYDPEAEPDETPTHEVTLSPYFVGKHEVTRAQWRAMTGGDDPSAYAVGESVGDRTVTIRNPVERVSWEDCDRHLSRHGLGFATEAQWEHAARAGTDTPWVTGRDVAALGKVANVCDAYCKEHGGPPRARYTLEVNDGHRVHAPVGTYAANAFGLHDLHGNVHEWCRDAYARYAAVAATDPRFEGSGPRVCRGGSWDDLAAVARSANRLRRDPGYRDGNLGIRAARPLVP